MQGGGALFAYGRIKLTLHSCFISKNRAGVCISASNIPQNTRHFTVHVCGPTQAWLQDHSFNLFDKVSTTHCSVPKLACPSDGVSPCFQCCCTKLPPSSPHHLHHHHHHQHHQHQDPNTHTTHRSLTYLCRVKSACA